MNLIEGLQKEIDRIRELIKIYEATPDNAGMFAAQLMKNSITYAEKAVAEGEIVDMVRAYQDLKEFED